MKVHAKDSRCYLVVRISATRTMYSDASVAPAAATGNLRGALNTAKPPFNSLDIFKPGFCLRKGWHFLLAQCSRSMLLANQAEGHWQTRRHYMLPHQIYCSPPWSVQRQ